MQKATRSLPVRLSKKQDPKHNLSWFCIWQVVWAKVSIVWVLWILCDYRDWLHWGKRGENMTRKALECLLVAAWWKDNRFIPLTSTWPLPLFLSAVRHPPFPAASNTSLYVLMSRGRVGSTLDYCHLSVAVTPVSSQSVCMLPLPAPLLHWLKQRWEIVYKNQELCIGDCQCFERNHS